MANDDGGGFLTDGNSIAIFGVLGPGRLRLRALTRAHDLEVIHYQRTLERWEPIAGDSFHLVTDGVFTLELDAGPHLLRIVDGGLDQRADVLVDLSRGFIELAPKEQDPWPPPPPPPPVVSWISEAKVEP